MNSYYNITNKRLYHRGQIDVIDMPVKLTCDYKYFFVYEDQISRFVVLKGLNGNTANEVAVKLLDIFVIIGAPQVLQSNNGRKFAKDVVQEIRLLCKDFIILHGEMSESKEPRDFKNLLERWTEKNPTKTWYEAAKYIQIFQNSTFRSANGRIPYDILFGRNVHEDFEKVTNTIDSRENIWAEEEWNSLLPNETRIFKREGSVHLIEDSTFTDSRDVDSVKDCESDSFSEIRDDLQGDTPGFNFVDVKSEEILYTEDSMFEDESDILDDKAVLAKESQIDLKCKVCQKQYTKPGYLKNHMRTHLKRKKFECTMCNKTFHVLSLYEKHLRQSHRQSKLSSLNRKRRSKDSQDESMLDAKPSKLRSFSSLNRSETQSNKTDDCPKTTKRLCLVKEKRKITTDSRSMKINGDPTLKCSYCNQKFNFPSVLKRHIRSHTNERPYICEICNKSFKQLGHLSQHSLTHRDCRIFRCAICHTKFESLNSLKTHAASHKENYILKTNQIFRLYECDHCKKVFTTKCVLERHIHTHSRERHFPCKICGKTFKQAGHLKSHMLVHTGERNFECSICQKRFSLSNSLKKHMYVHNGQKPYQCDVCGARFLEKRNLNGHLLTHTNERPFKCKLCGKRYTLADTLRRHISATHEEGRTYQCEICAKMFKQLAHLSVHKKVHNDERPFQCHLCEKNFKHKNVLKSHLAIHANLRPFECDICKATFVRKTNVQTHITSAHMNERPYLCIICGKRFKQISHLNGHAVVHNNLTPYQCDFCDRRCNRLDNLKKHMRLHTKNKE